MSQAGATRLALRRLTLTRFRGYESARLDADRRPAVLTGPNGAGKTNLLEAISLLAPGRGLRRAKLAEIERIGSPPGAGWAVAATLDTPSGPVDVGTGCQPQQGEAAAERRVVRIDGQPARSQVALAEHVAIVWLTPQMDRLFVEGSSGRRRFLDRLVFGFDPGHAARLNRHDHAMRERARLLREARAQGRAGTAADELWISALEEAMAATGVAAAAARLDTVRRLGLAAAAVAPSFPEADLAALGPIEDLLRALPALVAEEQVRARLAAARRQDAESGGAAVGPHKADLAVSHRARQMPAALCSTGEQKALLIAVVLANARAVAAERGTVPLLLLDEVAAHLDARRRAALFEEILSAGSQAWLTGTDAEVFAALGDRAQHYAVDNEVVARR